jgi:hypothetical protein
MQPRRKGWAALAAREVNSISMSQTRQYIAIALLAVGLLAGVPYLVFPMMRNGIFCPAATFAHGPMWSILLYVSGVLLSMFSYTYLYIGLWPKNNGEPRFKYKGLDSLVDNHWRLFIAGSICGLGLGGIIWFDTLDSYYCLRPHDIILHPSAFVKAQLLTWSDVATVQAECQHTKSGSVGGLVISFRGEQQIWVPLGRGEYPYALEYRAIRKALEGHYYDYITDLNVAESECPRVVYTWFASQLGHQN